MVQDNWELKNSHNVHVYVDFSCFKNAFISVPFRKCESHFYLNNKNSVADKSGNAVNPTKPQFFPTIFQPPPHSLLALRLSKL